MAKMIATKAQTYDRKTINAGEEFEVADAYVATLVSLGRARLKNGKGTKAEPTTRKAVEADEDTGKYKTRQVKAEGDK